MEAEGGNPGLVVMGRDSHSEGRGFKSQSRILDGHFSHIFVVKLERWKDENKRKRGRGWHIFKKDAENTMDNVDVGSGIGSYYALA